MRINKLLIACAAAAAFAPAAHAATDSDSLSVTANITAACSIAAPSAFVLDGRNFFDGFVESGNLTVWCTNGETVNVTGPNGTQNLTGTNNATNQIPFTVGVDATGYTSDGTDQQVGFDLTFAGGVRPKADDYTASVTFTVTS